MALARIIVAEDDPAVRKILVRVLENEGHEVRSAPGGHKAIELFNDDPADLVITDIFMPDGDGLEAIAELRRSAPGLNIIAISGGAVDDDKDYLGTALRLGARRTLPKPLHVGHLLETVRDLLTL